MSDYFDLTGKVAIVTGSGRGLGAAMARGLAQHGAVCGWGPYRNLKFDAI